MNCTKIFLIVACIILFSQTVFGEEKQGPLKFTIGSDQTTHATSDRVIVRLEIENVSGADVDVVDFQQVQSWLLSAQVVSFEIKDADGKIYPLEGPVVDYWPGERVTRLNKGGKMETSLIINDVNAKNYYRMGKQSTYTITAHYYGWEEQTVASNTIKITLE